MLKDLINLIPTSREVLCPLSARASIPGLTLVRPCGACTRVNPGIDARADNRPRTSLSVGILYVYLGYRGPVPDIPIHREGVAALATLQRCQVESLPMWEISRFHIFKIGRYF